MIKLDSAGWLPCPHCGSAEIHVHKHAGEGTGWEHRGDDVYSMCCYSCGATVANRYRLEAMKETWNRRPAVPSEGIASVAASDQQIDKAARVIAERMDYPWEHMPEKGRDNMRSIARAALAASDESLSRQSSEAAESLRSTRNTQGGGS